MVKVEAPERAFQAKETAQARCRGIRSPRRLQWRVEGAWKLVGMRLSPHPLEMLPDIRAAHRGRDLTSPSFILTRTLWDLHLAREKH